MSAILSCGLILIGLLILLLLLGRKPGVTLRDVEKETQNDLLEIEREVVDEVKKDLRSLKPLKSTHESNQSNSD